MYKILLVEDDAAVRYVYSRMKIWTENGFVIAAEAANGKDALRLLDEKQFDLVLTDIKMPLIDGISLLQKIKETEPDMPVILMSSYMDFEYARKGLVYGAFDYLTKPFKESYLEEVLTRVKKVLAQNSENGTMIRLVRSTFEKLGVQIDQNSFLEKVSVYFSKNIQGDFSMQKIADEMGLNKDYFGKLFKLHTTKSFNQFCNILKVELAKMLFDTGVYKTYEVSEMLGFSSADYFTKVFKDVAGMTPNAYKS